MSPSKVLSLSQLFYKTLKWTRFKPFNSIPVNFTLIFFKSIPLSLLMEWVFLFEKIFLFAFAPYWPEVLNEENISVVKWCNCIESIFIDSGLINLEWNMQNSRLQGSFRNIYTFKPQIYFSEIFITQSE